MLNVVSCRLGDLINIYKGAAPSVRDGPSLFIILTRNSSPVDHCHPTTHRPEVISENDSADFPGNNRLVGNPGTCREYLIADCHVSSATVASIFIFQPSGGYKVDVLGYQHHGESQ